MWLVAAAYLILVQPVFAVSDAEKMLQEQLNNPLMKSEGSLTGEGVCWHAAFGMEKFVAKFRTTNDTSYLDMGSKYYDALISKMHTSPDGYRGWVGPYEYDEKFICDAHVSDAILINPMLEFAEIVFKSKDGELRRKYEKKAKAYLELAKKDVIEKWDRRGTWQEDGPLGAYVSWDRYMTIDNLKEWRKFPVVKSNLSLPFNKNMDMGLTLLRLYRITGNEYYREKALKIFNFTKIKMSLFDNHYIWNYWEPFSIWDVDTANPNALRLWVNVHPNPNYQAGEIYAIVEAYHSGITFSKEDIQRMINTNLKVMWNGDKVSPKWVNSNTAVLKAVLGQVPEVKTPKGGIYDKGAGTLWTALADFDPTIRLLAKVDYSSPPSFDRKYAELPVTEFIVPLNSNRYFTMVCLLPTTVKRAGWTYVVSKSIVPGNIEVALYTSDGIRKLVDIYNGNTTGGLDGREGLLIHKWQLNNVQPGDYRVRWTLKGEYREYPLLVK